MPMRALASDHMPSFLRFCAVGAVGFGIDAGLLTALLAAVPGAVIGARLASILAALTATWALNRRLTFGSHDPKRLAEWSRFAGVNGLGAVLNFTAYASLLHAVPGLAPLVALTAGSALALVFNYLGSRRFVFLGGPSGAS